MLPVFIDPLFVASGFLAGIVIGLTGVGGGSLMTPLLILVFGVHPASAVGTDLLFASVTKSAGATVHGFSGTIEWAVAGRLALGSIPATAMTLFLISSFGLNTAATDALITWVLSLALCAAALVLIFRSQIEARFGKSLANLPPARTRNITVLMGVALGVLVSLSSVGAGALGVMGLVLLYPYLPMSRIIGTDIAHAVPLTLVAGLGHWFFGFSDVAILVSLLAGSVPGVILGSFAAPRFPENTLRYLLAGTLLIAGGRLVF